MSGSCAGPTGGPGRFWAHAGHTTPHTSPHMFGDIVPLIKPLPMPPALTARINSLNVKIAKSFIVF